MTPDEIAAARWENHQRKLEVEADMRQRALNYDYSADDGPKVVTPPPQPALTMQQKASLAWSEEIRSAIRNNNDVIAEAVGEQTGKLHRELDSTTIALQNQIDALRDQIANLFDEIQFLRDQQERAAKWWFRR